MPPARQLLVRGRESQFPWRREPVDRHQLFLRELCERRRGVPHMARILLDADPTSRHSISYRTRAASRRLCGDRLEQAVEFSAEPRRQCCAREHASPWTLVVVPGSNGCFIGAQHVDTVQACQPSCRAYSGVYVRIAGRGQFVLSHYSESGDVRSAAVVFRVARSVQWRPSRRKLPACRSSTGVASKIPAPTAVVPVHGRLLRRRRGSQVEWITHRSRGCSSCRTGSLGMAASSTQEPERCLWHFRSRGVVSRHGIHLCDHQSISLQRSGDAHCEDGKLSCERNGDSTTERAWEEADTQPRDATAGGPSEDFPTRRCARLERRVGDQPAGQRGRSGNTGADWKSWPTPRTSN